MYKHLVAAVCVLVVCLAAVHPAWAQRGGSFRRLFGVSKAQLAALPEVQAELKLTDEQMALVAQINDELGKKQHEVLGTSFGRFSELRGKLERLSREAAKSVDEALEPSQRKRLQEIAIQQNHARALLDADVAAELGLSAEQQTKLAAAGDENGQAFEQAFAEFGRDGWRQRSSELTDEANKRLLAVLTNEQQATLEQMKGEAFDIDLSQLYRGGGGPR